MKKLIALLLATAMLLSLGTVAFAANTSGAANYITSTALFMKSLANNGLCKTVDRYVGGINYVALGDSTSVGLFLGDYVYSYRHNTGADGTEYPSGEYSEYTLFMDYLEKTYPGVTINGSDLTMPAMRPIQLRGILGGAEEDANIRARTGMLVDSTYIERMDAYTGQSPDYSLIADNTYESYQEMHDTFTAKLKAADVISYDMLMIDSLPTLVAGLANIASVPASLNMFPSLLQEEGFSLMSIGAESLRSSLNSILSCTNLPKDTINNLLDYLLYTYAGIVINVSKNMNWIYRNNRSAEVIIVGPINYISNISVNLGGATVNIGRLWDCMADAIIAYLVKVNPLAGWYHLADSSMANETCMEAYAQGKLTTDPDYAMIWDMMKEKYVSTDKDLVGHEDEIKANVAAACEYFMTNPIDDPIPFMKSFQGGGEGLNDALYAGIDANIDGVNYRDVVADKDDMTALASALMFNDYRTGMHPSAEGCKQKAAAIIDAFESRYSAKDYYTYCKENFVKNSVGAVLGIAKSQTIVIATLKKFLTPIVDLSSLLAVK